MGKNNKKNNQQEIPDIPQKILIDFSYFDFIFRSTSYDEFTNYLSDCDSFFEQLKYIFEILVPSISEYTYDNVCANTKHSHAIPVNSKELTLIHNIIKQKLKEHDNKYSTDEDIELFFENSIYDYQIWQLGLSGGTRIIGTRYLNTFRPLFFDYHHLVYPDKNFNQPNYKKYRFCPIKGE